MKNTLENSFERDFQAKNPFHIFLSNLRILLGRRDTVECQFIAYCFLAFQWSYQICSFAVFPMMIQDHHCSANVATSSTSNVVVS